MRSAPNRTPFIREVIIEMIRSGELDRVLAYQDSNQRDENPNDEPQ